MIQKNKKGYRNLQSKFNLIVLTVFLLTTLLIQSTIAFTPDDINTVIKQLTTMRDDSLKSSIGSAVSETDFERIKTSTAFIAASIENKYIEELYNQRYKRAQENNFGEGSWIGDNWFYLLLIPLFGVGALFGLFLLFVLLYFLP